MDTHYSADARVGYCVYCICVVWRDVTSLIAEHEALQNRRLRVEGSQISHRRHRHHRVRNIPSLPACLLMNVSKKPQRPMQMQGGHGWNLFSSTNFGSSVVLHGWQLMTLPLVIPLKWNKHKHLPESGWPYKHYCATSFVNHMPPFPSIFVPLPCIWQNIWPNVQMNEAHKNCLKSKGDALRCARMLSACSILMNRFWSNNQLRIDRRGGGEVGYTQSVSRKGRQSCGLLLRWPQPHFIQGKIIQSPEKTPWNFKIRKKNRGGRIQSHLKRNFIWVD